MSRTCILQGSMRMSEAKSFRRHVLALLGEQYGDRTLVLCPTAFVKLLYGDDRAAILSPPKSSSSDRTEDPDGWLDKSPPDWTAENGLPSPRSVASSRATGARRRRSRTLRDFGVETRLRGQSHRRAHLVGIDWTRTSSSPPYTPALGNRILNIAQGRSCTVMRMRSRQRRESFRAMRALIF